VTGLVKSFQNLLLIIHCALYYSTEPYSINIDGSNMKKDPSVKKASIGGHITTESKY
jgi:hypothetical protein